MQLDEDLIKRDLIQMWRQRGLNTLVKVMDLRLPLNARMDIGYCTSIKFLAGRTPLQLEKLVGFKDNSKLETGAAIYLVPLPRVEQVTLRGYTHTPGGISTGGTRPPKEALYQIGAGAPQWQITGLKQTSLMLLVKLLPNQSFNYPVNSLNPI